MRRLQLELMQTKKLYEEALDAEMQVSRRYL